MLLDIYPIRGGLVRAFQTAEAQEIAKYQARLEKRFGRWLLDIEPTSGRVERDCTRKLSRHRVLASPLARRDMPLG